MVNKRNLSLQDLLSQCAHYNANVRKEAVLGMKDLFSLHPQSLGSSLARLFDKVFDLISDEDLYVRQAIRTLFEFLLPLIPARLMQPYMKLFVIYLTNGMTNINLDVRLSALELIKLVIVHLPEFLPTFYIELLPNFLDLLASVGFGTRSSTLPRDTSKKTGFQKHLPILKSLYHLLKSVHAYKTAQASEQKTSTSTSASSTSAFSWDWTEYKRRWPQAHARFFMTKGATGSNVESMIDQNSPVLISESAVLTDFSKKIIPSLLKRWLECSPSDPFTSTANLECMALVLDIIHMLFILNDKANKRKEGEHAAASQTSVVFGSFLADFKKYLMPHFPISEPISKSVEDKKSKEGANMRLTVSRLNCTLCAVMAHFVEPKAIEEIEMELEAEKSRPAPPTAAPLPAFLQKRDDKARDPDDDVMKTLHESNRPDKWMTALYRHIVKKLKDKETAGNKGMVQEVSLLLPVVQKLLPALSPPLQTQLMEAFHSFYLACHIMSQAKRKCIKWIVVLLTTPAHTRGGWSPDSTMTQQWILSFPQILWKLQDKNTTTTQLILTTLVELINRKRHDSEALHTSLQSLKDHLVPFFFTQVPATKTRKASNIYGPFVLLPEELQRLALQLVYYFDSLPAKLLKSLTACSRNLNMSVLRYMTEILYHSYVKGALSQFELASTVLSLLVANSANRKYQERADEDEDDDGEEVEELAPQVRKRTRTSSEATTSTSTSTSTHKQMRSRAVKDTQKGKEKENEMEVVVVDADDDDEGEPVVEDRVAAAGGEKAAAKAERARTERREVAEIIVANVRLWGVTEALESMQAMLTLLLTTEATDVETKEALLLFLCLCARTRRASHDGGTEAAPTGLPQGLAAVMPQAIFASLTADWQQAEESLAAKRYESVLDILASDSSILSAYLALLLDKLDGQRDQVLHLVLSLVLESRLQPMFAAADIRSRLQPLASALLQGTDTLTPAQHKLQVEMQLLYGSF